MYTICYISKGNLEYQYNCVRYHRGEIFGSLSHWNNDLHYLFHRHIFAGIVHVYDTFTLHANEYPYCVCFVFLFEVVEICVLLFSNVPKTYRNNVSSIFYSSIIYPLLGSCF